VVVEDLGTEEVNESLFCTAVDNLIRNGLRYNDSDTKLVKLYREEGVLVVEDNGRGMSQEQFDEFSKPYTRGENNKESGSGLGLNICVAIMTEHGFKVNSEKVKTGTKLKIEMS
jgi:signal transduction histidine kinase